MANFPANDSGHLTIVSLHRSSGHCRSKLRKVGAGIGLPAGALLFLVPFIFAQNSPRVTNVEPASGKVNESVTLTGTDLGKDSVSAVFLSDGTNDYKATVLEQAGEKIIIKVPEVKSGGYNISIRQVDRIFIEPFRLTVLQPTPPPKAMRSAPPPSQAKPPVVPATFYGYVTDAHTGTRRAFFHRRRGQHLRAGGRGNSSGTLSVGADRKRYGGTGGDQFRSAGDADDGRQPAMKAHPRHRRFSLQSLRCDGHWPAEDVLSRPPKAFCCMEERPMNQTTDRRHRRAVVCLFCGLLTPVPEDRYADDPRISIIRCYRCGKEAPYPADTIIGHQNMPNSGTPKVRAAGFSDRSRTSPGKLL